MIIPGRILLGALSPDNGLTPPVRPSPTAYWSQAKKWESLDPAFAVQLQNLISLMETEYGWRTEIDNGWRPWSTQSAYNVLSTSPDTSLHNAVDTRLRPAALAADVRVVSAHHGALSDYAQTSFFRALREAAVRVGLRAGGWFGVSDAEQGKGTWEARMGGDPPHIEHVSMSPGKLRGVLTARYAQHGITTPMDTPVAAMDVPEDKAGGISPTHEDYIPFLGETLPRMPPDTGTTLAGPRGAWDFPSAVSWTPEEKWRGLNPQFAMRLHNTIATLRNNGWPATSIDNGWRPWSTQAGFHAAGASHTLTSYHNYVTHDLIPDALAADVRAPRSLSDADKLRFYRDLRKVAVENGLVSGGWWNRKAGGGTEYTSPMGWDPAHVELRLLDPQDLVEDLTVSYVAHGLLMPPGGDTGTPPDDTAAQEGPFRVSMTPPPPEAPSSGAVVVVAGVAVAGVAYAVWKGWK